MFSGMLAGAQETSRTKKNVHWTTDAQDVFKICATVIQSQSLFSTVAGSRLEFSFQCTNSFLNHSKKHASSKSPSLLLSATTPIADVTDIMLDRDLRLFSGGYPL